MFRCEGFRYLRVCAKREFTPLIPCGASGIPPASFWLSCSVSCEEESNLSTYFHESKSSYKEVKKSKVGKPETR